MLDDLLVIALDQAVCAPFAASRLADYGARVIKVERPGGDFARKYDDMIDGSSAAFAWLNRGKESIELDLRDAGDKSVFLKMIAKADVFIQNLSPGALERMDLGPAALSVVNPKLVQCSITGFGMDGPLAKAKAYDMLLQAESGLASISGSDGSPGRVGVSIVDIATGMTAINAILLALRNREQTGKGSTIDISMFDVIADWMAMPLMQYQLSGEIQKNEGFSHPSIAPYGVYKTGDGLETVIAIQNDTEWQNFCRVVLEDATLGIDPMFASNSVRVANRLQVNKHITVKLNSLTNEELVSRLLEAKIAYGRINDVADLSKHSQLHLQTIEAYGKPVSLPDATIEVNGKRHLSTSVPLLSEHAEKIRREFS